MRDLLRLVAFQLGSEVSYEELGKQLGMSKTTVEKYLDLLEKVFVIYRLGAYSRNLRKEVTKAGKWYFYDNGIRNAVIGAFSPLSIRQDVGALWENYLIGERRKTNFNEGLYKGFYFCALTTNRKSTLSRRMLTTWPHGSSNGETKYPLSPRLSKKHTPMPDSKW